jgi:hypothetical protein
MARARVISAGRPAHRKQARRLPKPRSRAAPEASRASLRRCGCR